MCAAWQPSAVLDMQRGASCRICGQQNSIQVQATLGLACQQPGCVALQHSAAACCTPRVASQAGPAHCEGRVLTDRHSCSRQVQAAPRPGTAAALQRRARMHAAALCACAVPPQSPEQSRLSAASSGMMRAAVTRGRGDGRLPSVGGMAGAPSTAATAAAAEAAAMCMEWEGSSSLRWVGGKEEEVELEERSGKVGGARQGDGVSDAVCSGYAKRVHARMWPAASHACTISCHWLRPT